MIFVFSLIFFQFCFSIEKPEIIKQYLSCRGDWCFPIYHNSPIYKNDRLYVGIHIYNASTFEQIWKEPGLQDGTSNANNVYMENCLGSGRDCIASSDYDKTLKVYYADNGEYLSGFPKLTKYQGREIMSLNAAKLSGTDWNLIVGTHHGSGDGQYEVLFVYDLAGNLKWSSMNTSVDQTGNIYSQSGVFGDNVCVCDLQGTGVPLVFAPHDMCNVAGGYRPDGSVIGSYLQEPPYNSDRSFGGIPNYVDVEIEHINYLWCLSGKGDSAYMRAESTREGCACIPDPSDSQKKKKLLLQIANVYNCSTNGKRDTSAVFLRNSKGERFVYEEGDIDTTIPYQTDIQQCDPANPSKCMNNKEFQLNPAIADIDGDGSPDIVFTAADGQIHALDLNLKPLRGFPFALKNPLGLEMPTDPVIADVDGDGRLELVFCTRFPFTKARGRLVILSNGGKIKTSVEFPKVIEGDPEWKEHWNTNANVSGCTATPTVYKNATTGNTRILVPTSGQGMIVMEIPNTGGSGMFVWPTAKGSYHRVSDSNFDAAVQSSLPPDPDDFKPAARGAVVGVPRFGVVMMMIVAVVLLLVGAD